jgi:hypothetical protein
MTPILLIAVGIIVLLFGKRLAVLGAAVGALIGLALLPLFSETTTATTELIVVGVSAVIGAIVGGFSKGVVEVIILVLGALAGAAIVGGFLSLFNMDTGIVRILGLVLGGTVGFFGMRRSRRGEKDWGIMILAGLVGGMLVARGLYMWFPELIQGWVGTLVVLALAGFSVAYQGGMLGGKSAAAPAQPAAAASAPAQVNAAPVVPPAAPPAADKDSSSVQG